MLRKKLTFIVIQLIYSVDQLDCIILLINCTDITIHFFLNTQNKIRVRTKSIGIGWKIYVTYKISPLLNCATLHVKYVITRTVNCILIDKTKFTILPKQRRI